MTVRLGPSPNQINLDKLRAAVAGRDPSFPRSEAMALLVTSKASNKEEIFEALLFNESEETDIRYLAGISLGRINTPAAIDALVRSSHIRNDQVLAGVMQALGRIGGERALDIALRVKDESTGYAAAQARFAAALISYRLGLPTNDLPVPNASSYLKLSPIGTHPISFSLASKKDAELYLRLLTNQPFGIEYADQPIYQIRCEPRTMMIVFNKSFAGERAVRKLASRRALFAVVATWFEETKTYCPSLLVLTSPAIESEALNILVPRPTGELIFGGTGRIHNDRLEFSVHAISRPGAVAVVFEGTIMDGQLDITNAQSAITRQKNRQPRLISRNIVPS